MYKKYRTNDKIPVEFDSAECQEQINELKQYGFTNIKSKVYKRIRRLTSEKYISLVKTYSTITLCLKNFGTLLKMI
ncbi:MAG: hypothetical protein ACI4HM_08885 [Ruminococcus sp.]